MQVESGNKYREWWRFAAVGALGGYALGAVLFFSNRLTLASGQFLQLALYLALFYSVIGLLGGGLAELSCRLAGRIPAWRDKMCGAARHGWRWGIFGWLALFTLLFFWHFDSFYRYSTFNFDLLVKRLLGESFFPGSLSGLKNLAHLAALMLAAALAPVLLVALHSRLAPAIWKKGVRICALVVVLVPWGGEIYQTWFAQSEDLELRARPGRKVLILAIDALDWQLTQEFIAAGWLPNLQRIAEQGSFTRLETFTPAYSPMVWTTIASGKKVEEHNIRHFHAYSTGPVASVQPLMEPSLLMGNAYLLRLMAQWGLVERRSVTGNTRRVPAFWDITSQADLTTVVLGWWATAPAEALNGVMVTDYAPHTGGAAAPLGPHVYPAEFIPQAATAFQAATELPSHWLRQLFDLTPVEESELGLFAADLEEIVPRAMREMVRSLRHDYGLFLTARLFLEKEQPEVMAVFFEGIDTAGHMTMHHWLGGDKTALDSLEVRHYQQTMRQYYRIVDEMVGELYRQMDEETYVMVMSDHGFELVEAPNYFHHKSGPDGVLMLAGPEIKASATGHFSAHIYDVLPTLLHVLGLPVGQDMSGRVLEQAFSERYKQRYEVAVLPTYDALRSGRHRSTGAAEQADQTSAQMVDRLKALGYIE